MGDKLVYSQMTYYQRAKLKYMNRNMRMKRHGKKERKVEIKQF